jgi:radical SAM superfamily enzyme YgiQ (UPF0313 family)
MKIALLDLNHTTRGTTTNAVPLGIGLIASYLKQNGDGDFDIKLFKDPAVALSVLETWKPDILGVAQYVWNSHLNLHFAEKIKRTNPGCIVITGGPNLPLSGHLKKQFLGKNDFVDVCISFDGEISFTEIAKLVLKGTDIDKIRSTPVAGAYALDPKTKTLMESPLPPPHINSLDVFGAVYEDGIFDEFLDAGFHPFVQTHRGCPFSCAFCHTSHGYYTRMIFQSPEVFARDMEYLGKRYAGRHDVPLEVANTNMSLFKEDFEIAGIIRQTRQRYDWPHIIYTNSGKDPQKLLDMQSIIEFWPSIALQTLTPDVLKNIGRKNITIDEFTNFQKKAIKNNNAPSSTELILCLPGETKESFFESLSLTLNSGVQNVTIYTLMNLAGTPLASEEFQDKYGLVKRHRVVPRTFSTIDGTRILDTEEVIIGTNTMSIEDYFELRGLAFSVSVFFSAIEFLPLRRLLLEYNLDLTKWLYGLHRRIFEYPDLLECYNEFIRETREELFESREELVAFFNVPQNFEMLCSGKLGDNLTRKYKCIVLLQHYKSCLELVLSETHNALAIKLDKTNADNLIHDLRMFLQTRDLHEFIFGSNGEFLDKRIRLAHDIPAWLSTSHKDARLQNFVGNFIYDVTMKKESQDLLKNLGKVYGDMELQLQILYRDGAIQNFWPIWTRPS